MIPARDDVAAALRHVDYRGVIVNDAVVTLRDRWPASIWAASRRLHRDGILALLRERGVEHALVNQRQRGRHGGGKPDGAPWRVGVRRPLPPARCRCLIRSPSWPLRDGSADKRHLRARLRAGRETVPPYP